ncbi:jg8350 [Pararge aegeria aegeria]|uniref:Jg8350 protein n=1 Tax=Pararge aegeria aegeria TaxID=348720 RepID=A0A8S4SIW1_9NEOP|nr:jg8350 [Pararge aegeria aegeria]
MTGQIAPGQTDRPWEPSRPMKPVVARPIRRESVSSKARRGAARRAGSCRGPPDRTRPDRQAMGTVAPYEACSRPSDPSGVGKFKGAARSGAARRFLPWPVRAHLRRF